MSIRKLLGLALASAVAGAPWAGPAAAQDLERGEVLYALCAQCHGDAGEGRELYEAPPIAGLGAWYVEKQLHKFRNGVRGAHPDDAAGLRMRPMARTLRSDEDITAVSAYVANLAPVQAESTIMGGDPAKGKALYEVCGTCHGVNGEGNPATFGPALSLSSDWYIVSQLHKFQSGIRGSNPKDTEGVLMRPMSMTVTGEQQIKDLVAYIMTFSN